MNPFLNTVRLLLTPLSPIHIGCGEDFIPTNYLIEDGFLYAFDPSHAELNDLQRSELKSAVDSNSLNRIHGFFRNNSGIFKSQSKLIIPVSSGVASSYQGQRQNTGELVNQLFIERTISTSRPEHPFIPGSSFKGALRTVILDSINDGNPPPEPRATSSSRLETTLFKGDFDTSPLRLLKIADLMPTGNVDSKVMFAVNRKKARVIVNGKEAQSASPSVRKECILHGQYRCFTAEAAIQSIEPYDNHAKTPAPERTLKRFADIAASSNAYHAPRLRSELAMLEQRAFVAPGWKRDIERLLAGSLGQRLDAGEAFLVRIGRYGGAESKTLSGDGVAHIKIMQGKGMQPVFQSTTKTVWLAAETGEQRADMLPFGWAVVEIDPKGELPELRDWCLSVSQGRPDLVAMQTKFAQEKAAARALGAEKAAAAMQREAQRQAELMAQQQHAAALAALSPQARKVAELRSKLEELDARINTAGSNFRKQEPQASRAGLYQDADKLVKEALAAPDWTVADKTSLADLLEQALPRVIAPWDAKEQRRKLKLSALRGA